MRWRLVVEGDSDRSEAKANANVFVDMLRAEGHTVRQVTFYGEAERPGEDLTGVSSLSAPIAVHEFTEPEPTIPEVPDAAEGN